ncbi:Fructosamine kinase-domain-containing protein [Trichophaea hybrida]|nr:Fructosamine kinase-domain-containing protein [Trichophaea hybrida]
MHLMQTPPAGADLGQQIELDEAILARFPSGTKILSASRHGKDRFARSAKVVARLPNGEIHSFLLRGSAGESGKRLMRGEFESLGAIHSVVPNFCPKPICWGTFRSICNTFFNLSMYHERVSPPKDTTAFCASLAKLHTRSSPPDSRFGFPVHTLLGEVLNEKIATETWEECFTAGLRHMLELDEEINGVDDTLVTRKEELIARVIPRLLRPLETGGRKIRPALVHGNLCAANAGEIDSGGVMVFRPAAVFAHNEFELGIWRAVRNGFDRRFLRAYLKLVPISEPKADFEDRNALYALRHLIAYSIRYPGSAKYRREIIVEMGRLVERFSPKPERFGKEDEIVRVVEVVEEQKEDEAKMVVVVCGIGSAGKCNARLVKR